MSLILTILGIAATVAVVGAIIYLGVKLTISVLRNRRSSQNSEFLIYDAKEMMKHFSDRERHTISASELDPEGVGQYAKEFDPITGEVLNTFVCDKGMDERIDKAVADHEGYIIVENL